MPEGERHLERLQRMATLGTLASGLGHDLRNLVMPVLLRLDVVSATPDLPDKAKADLQSIRQSILRLQRLAGGLRLLATDPFEQRDEAQLTTLSEWWQEMHPIVVDALPPQTTLTVNFANDLPVVAVPPGTLAQILINLVMNARQAMEGMALPHLTITARSEPGRVMLDLADNGAGMDEETRRRCFEPYFTTRAREYATGLGLSTGRALLNRYGGNLALGEQGEQGTVITMALPAREVPAVSENGHRRRVRLLVSDPRQRAVLRLLIRHRGLSELAEAEPEAADVTICDASSLAAVLADSNMPATTTLGSRGQIFAIGAPVADRNHDHVRWVDPSDFTVLDDVLQ
jgi:signal transduction histidine kinase